MVLALKCRNMNRNQGTKEVSILVMVLLHAVMIKKLVDTSQVELFKEGLETFWSAKVGFLEQSQKGNKVIMIWLVIN